MDQRADQVNSADWRDEPGSEFEEARIVVVQDDDVSDETGRIRADIEDTRAELGQTINEIQERLSPQHIIEEVKESVRDATIGKVERAMDRVGETISNVTEPAVDAMGRAGTVIKETGSSVADTVRQNPIPAALIGLGVGMLLVNRWRGSADRPSRSRTYRAGTYRGYEGVDSGGRRQTSTLSSDFSTQQDEGAVHKAYDYVKGSARELADGTVETVSNLSDQTRDQVVRASYGLQRIVRNNPLAAGAAAVAVGAAVGLALPSTQVEEEYMGEASDKVVGKTKEVVREAMDKVQDAARRAGAD